MYETAIIHSTASNIFITSTLIITISKLIIHLGGKIYDKLPLQKNYPEY